MKTREELLALMRRQSDGYSRFELRANLQIGLTFKDPLGEQEMRDAGFGELVARPPNARGDCLPQQLALGLDVDHRVAVAAPDREIGDHPASLGALHGERLAAIGVDCRIELEAEHGLLFETAFTGDHVVAVLARRDMHDAHVGEAAAHRAHALEDAGGVGRLIERSAELSSQPCVRRYGWGCLCHVAFLVQVDVPPCDPTASSPAGRGDVAAARFQVATDS